MSITPNITVYFCRLYSLLLKLFNLLRELIRFTEEVLYVLVRGKMQKSHHLIVVYPYLVNFRSKLGQLAVILHGGLVHHNYLETFPKNTGTHKIRLVYSARFVAQVDGM